jgi:hypothetical protein
LTGGLSAMRTLPAVCVHMWSVAQVSRHSSRGRAGQLSPIAPVDKVSSVVMLSLHQHDDCMAADRVRLSVRAVQEAGALLRQDEIRDDGTGMD